MRPSVEGPEQHSDALVAAFAQAAGVAGVGRALQSARELKAVDYVGWPVSWLADRLLRRDPVRKIRLGTLWDELRSMSAGPAGAHKAEIDNAITALSDEIAPGLPAPWPATARSAARSQVDAIPSALGRAIADALPAENSAALWWRLVAVWQGLLLGGAVAGLAWLLVLIVAGILERAAAHDVQQRGAAALDRGHGRRDPPARLAHRQRLHDAGRPDRRPGAGAG